MKKKIIATLLALILVVILFAGCMNNKPSEEYINDWNKNSEKIRQLQEEMSRKEMNDWCGFYCHFEKQENTSRYWFGEMSGGDGNVTVSFKFDDKNATVYGEEYMKQNFIGNFTWRIYTTARSELQWVFYIFSDSSANITLRVVKDLVPFPSCPDCKFQSIIKELKFKNKDKVRGFL